MTAAPAAFAGFPKEGMAFLAGLAKNNRRDWFVARKDDFERHVKAPMVALLAALEADLRDAAPGVRIDPKKALMRMNRDVRFSKDKSPYRTQIAARFGRAAGKDAEAAGFFLSVSPAGVDVAGGSHALDARRLDALRRRIAAAPEAFRALVTDRAVLAAMGELQGERLVRVPKGWPPDHPAADLLRLKQAYFYATLPASLSTTPRLRAEVSRRLRLLAPFVAWMSDAVGPPAPR
jgi:uncharacterized protein (TIGR02453 family)